MIKIIDGDLLTSGADIICHQVNCQGKMNSGVAKQIREKWPEVYNAYINIIEESKFSGLELLGFCQFLYIKKQKIFIANLFGQNYYGYDNEQYTDMDALKNSLLMLRNHVYNLTKGKNISKSEIRIAMPWKIGCDRGGANWTDVYSMIHFIFEDYNVELWRLDKG